MRKLLSTLFLASALSASGATTWGIYTLTVTNWAASNDWITVNSSTRTASSNRTATTFITNTLATVTTTNIFSQFGGWPVAGVIVSNTSPTNIVFQGLNMSATVYTNIGYMTSNLVTIATNRWFLQFPFEAFPVTLRQTNASQIVTAIGSWATNYFAEADPPLSNFVGKTSAQIVSGKVLSASAVSNCTLVNVFASGVSNLAGIVANLTNGTLHGTLLSNVTLHAAGGYMSNIIGHSITITNLDAPGAGLQSQRIGDSSTAIGAYALAFGVSAEATNNGSVAVGNSASSQGASAIAIGTDTIANAFASIAIGGETYATAWGAVSLGISANAGHSNSVALGTSANTTTTNQIRLGTASEHVSIPGRLLVEGSTTNLTFRGTNNLNGDLQLVPRSNSDPANGNNTGVVLGTNVYIRISGPTTIAAFGGFASERDGAWHIVQFASAVTNILVNEGSATWSQDATAANRILTGTGGDLALTNQPAFATLLYDGAASRWRVVHHSH